MGSTRGGAEQRGRRGDESADPAQSQLGVELRERPQAYLIRDGETAWSLTGQHTGLTDIALTAHGEDEARALAPCLRTTYFSKILTSPLRRARQTCELAGFGPDAEI